MIARLTRWWTERQKTHGVPRSPHWPAVRHRFLLEHPRCAACGTQGSLEVHHVLPFHLAPEFELDPANLITLCEGVNRCHLLIGHGGAWKRSDPDARADAARALAGQRVTAEAHARAAAEVA